MEHQEKFIKAVNAELEEWRLSGDVDYLHKAAAEINSAIKKEGGEIFCQDNPLKRKEQKA